MDNQNKASKTTIITSLIWKLLERGGVQGIQMVVQIVLARLLEPSDFGVITLLTVFINLANVLVQTGFNTALIQKKNVDETDLSSVFWLNIVTTGILYAVLYFTAPIISAFYELPVLTPVLRVFAVVLFFGALNSVQNAVVARNMAFKKMFVCSLSAVVLSGAAGIAAAYTGFGVWALVVQQISYNASLCVIMFVVIRWRPQFVFSFQRIKGLFSFGWKLLVSGLINTLYTQLSSLIIGKKYDETALAFYNRGEQFPTLIAVNLDSAVQSVLLPAYSQYQDERTIVRNMMRRAIQLSTFVLFPFLFGLAAVAESAIELLLTEKWLPCVPYMQILCVSYALYPIHSVNLQAINALGYSDKFLKLEIIKKAYGVALLLISMQFGTLAMALSTVVSGFISTFVNSAPNKELLNYSYKEQWADIMPAFVLSAVMAIAVRPIHLLGLTPLITLIIQVPMGIIIYLVGSMAFKLDGFTYIIRTLKSKIH